MQRSSLLSPPHSSLSSEKVWTICFLDWLLFPQPETKKIKIKRKEKHAGESNGMCTQQKVVSQQPLGCRLRWRGGAGGPSQMDFLIYFNQSRCWARWPEIHSGNWKRPQSAPNAAAVIFHGAAELVLIVRKLQNIKKQVFVFSSSVR